MKALIIDDNLVISFLIEEAIGKDIETNIIDYPFNIKNVINIYKPNLVILDLILPNINGFEILRQIKSINPLIKVIVVSSINNLESIKKAKDLGCDLYVKKPFKLNYLKKVIKKFILPIN